MKIVVQYESGGHTFDDPSCEHVICLEYESTEAVLCGFEDALKKVQSEADRVKAARKEHQKRMPPRLAKSKTIDPAWVKWNSEFPTDTMPFEFYFAGIRFDLSDFENGTLPEVFELEEWFRWKLLFQGG